MIRTFKIYSWEFPGGLVIITLCSHCQGPGFDPWLGTKISQAMKHSQNKQIKNVKKDLFCLQFSNMQYTIVNCSYHVIHYICRIYLFIGSLYHLTTFTHFSQTTVVYKKIAMRDSECELNMTKIKGQNPRLCEA